jgi:membrane protease YdiL (CAAX protease family)
LLSSALFALGHFDSAGVVASSFFLGLVCAVALERGRSLWLPVAIHALNNSLAVMLLYLIQATQS